jgi:chemotaxis protein CheX
MQGGEPVNAKTEADLLQPIITATCSALPEMASVEPFVRAEFQRPLQPAQGDLSVVLDIVHASAGRLILSFPKTTADALARRVLAEVTETLDEAMVRDCMGEIANVIAGQAKALWAETAYPFAFSLPRVVTRGSPELELKSGQSCLVVEFGSTVGNFALQLALEL